MLGRCSDRSDVGLATGDTPPVDGTQGAPPPPQAHPTYMPQRLRSGQVQRLSVWDRGERRRQDRGEGPSEVRLTLGVHGSRVGGTSRFGL